MEKQFIREGVIRSEIENFLRRELDSAGYSGINIQKTPLSTRMTLYVEKPPLVIGRKGERIEKLTHVLKERYHLDNPSIDVQKVENPTLDPSIIARRVVSALERGLPRRRVAYKAIRAVMDSRAKGIEITLSGKIVGKGGRSRVEKYSQGYMKKAGDSTKLVDIGSKQAYLKAGVIGVTVRIVRPDVIFPDEFHVLEDPVVEPPKEETEVPAKETKKETVPSREKKATKKLAVKPAPALKETPGQEGKKGAKEEKEKTVKEKPKTVRSPEGKTPKKEEKTKKKKPEKSAAPEEKPQKTVKKVTQRAPVKKATAKSTEKKPAAKKK